MSKKQHYSESINEFEGEEIDLDALKGTEIKINPSFYQHLNLMKAQECLVSENIKGGMLQYFVNAEHMETLARSSGNLPEDYEAEYKKKLEEIGLEGVKIDTDDLISLSKRAKIKYELLLSHIFAKVEKKGIVKIKKSDVNETPQLQHVK